MKIIIVGGVAGGATAAARIRRLDEHAEITVKRTPYFIYFFFLTNPISFPVINTPTT